MNIQDKISDEQKMLNAIRIMGENNLNVDLMVRAIRLQRCEIMIEYFRNYNFVVYGQIYNMAELGVTFEINESRSHRNLGKASGRNKKITINKNNVEKLGYEHTRDTILHEIAHILEYVIFGEMSHSHNWTFLAQLIGSTGTTKFNHRFNTKFNWFTVYDRDCVIFKSL